VSVINQALCHALTFDVSEYEGSTHPQTFHTAKTLAESIVNHAIQSEKD
jgi:hypothetical protein